MKVDTVYVCVYVFMYICMYSCALHVFWRKRNHSCAQCMQTNMHARVYLCTPHIFGVDTDLCAHVCMHVCIPCAAHIFVWILMCVHTYVFVHVYTWALHTFLELELFARRSPSTVDGSGLLVAGASPSATHISHLCVHVCVSVWVHVCMHACIMRSVCVCLCVCARWGKCTLNAC